MSANRCQKEFWACAHLWLTCYNVFYDSKANEERNGWPRICTTSVIVPERQASFETKTSDVNTVVIVLYPASMTKIDAWWVLLSLKICLTLTLYRYYCLLLRKIMTLSSSHIIATGLVLRAMMMCTVCCSWYAIRRVQKVGPQLPTDYRSQYPCLVLY